MLSPQPAQGKNLFSYNSNFFNVVITAIFDETLNQVLQKEQMDFFIRYWSETNRIVVTKYFESKFMHKANARNIASAIEDSIESLQH